MATAYKVDTKTISAKVNQEFTEKEKAKTAKKAAPKAQLETAKKSGSGITANNRNHLCGASQTGSAFFCPAARFPALIRAPPAA